VIEREAAGFMLALMGSRGCVRSPSNPLGFSPDTRIWSLYWITQGQARLYVEGNLTLGSLAASLNLHSGFTLPAGDQL
jgi:hypothetical protein